MIEHQPIQISYEDIEMYGIIRGSLKSKKMIIFLSADSGTRIGPQRLFVEIAKSVTSKNYSALNIDLPPFGDSIDNCKREFEGDGYRNRLISRYIFYIDLIINHLEGKYGFNEYILLSISVGCLPILHYAFSNEKINKAILLSPNFLENNVSKINTSNLRTYCYKLLDIKYWEKIFLLKLDVRSILSNIFTLRFTNGKSKIAYNQNTDFKKIDVLSIFGQKDVNLSQCQKHWESCKEREFVNLYKERIVENSDHSFFGWNFKKEVISFIENWI